MFNAKPKAQERKTLYVCGRGETVYTTWPGNSWPFSGVLSCLYCTIVCDWPSSFQATFARDASNNFPFCLHGLISKKCCKDLSILGSKLIVSDYEHLGCDIVHIGINASVKHAAFIFSWPPEERVSSFFLVALVSIKQTTRCRSRKTLTWTLPSVTQYTT